MLAAEAKQVDVGKLIIAHFPLCVPWTNKSGMDAVCGDLVHAVELLHWLTMETE